MSTRIFTFGSDQSLPDGTPAGNAIVEVEAPDTVDHRAIFMAWLGSNEFSSEYTPEEFTATSMAGNPRTFVACRISIEGVRA